MASEAGPGDFSYAPYLPLQVLKPVGPDIWIADGPEIFFQVGPFRLAFPTRMTVVRLASGALWVHSPVEPTARLLAEVAALGPVESLIAPNSLHYWWIPDWHDDHPQAQVYLAPGLRQRAKRPLPDGPTLSDTAPAAWAGEIEQVAVAGGWFHEVEFFHRASRTLILVDLIENFEPARLKSPLQRWLVRAAGAAHPDGKAPYDMRMSFRSSRALLKAAVERMLGWHPERIVVAHGRWYDHDGEAELRRAFRWVL